MKGLIKGLRFVGEVLTLKLLGIRIVWTVHNLFEHERRNPQVELFFSRILVRLYDGLIVHCAFARDAIIQAYHLPECLGDRVHVIPHGHYIDSYDNQVTREQARDKLCLGERELVFLYFGLIRPYKGVFQLIEKFRTLEDPRVYLLIVGKPANDAITVELVQSCKEDSRISTYLRFIPDDEVQLYMNAADVMVLPYRDVLTSGAVILAMSFGKPVIAPRIGCIPDVLDDRGSFLYDPSDEKGLLKAMRLARDTNLAEMGKHSFDLAKQLRWDEIARRTYKLYQECLLR